ncbi:MAG: hypothetical protein PHH70_02840 [Candidatus Gracilibacteria bacterium]|nr:hypothetical protein [Candidatus Gracilibacteria bacterium]
MFQRTSFKYLFLSFFLLFPLQTFAFVPLVCDLCTIGVIAGLGVSRYLGIDDSVTGVWIGAFLVAIIQMTIALLEKKHIRFRFRTTVISLSFVVFSLLSFYYAGIIGIYRNTFFGGTSIFLDKVLLSSFAGGITLVLTSCLYQALKKRNGGHAHFPFEKVALPIASLVLLSVLFYFLTAR